jgi:hypothetical protein
MVCENTMCNNGVCSLFSGPHFDWLIQLYFSYYQNILSDIIFNACILCTTIKKRFYSLFMQFLSHYMHQKQINVSFFRKGKREIYFVVLDMLDVYYLMKFKVALTVKLCVMKTRYYFDFHTKY